MWSTPAASTDGGWELDDQAGATRRFDLLVVANGHHWDPRMAEFPGEFTGESIHSHHYIDPWTPLHLMDKRILVVGLGNSAADITVELSQRSLRNEVTLVDAQQRLDRAEADQRQGRRHELQDQPAPAAELAAQVRPVGPALHRLRPDALRPADAQPQVLRGAPDPVR